MSAHVLQRAADSVEFIARAVTSAIESHAVELMAEKRQYETSFIDYCLHTLSAEARGNGDLTRYTRVKDVAETDDAVSYKNCDGNLWSCAMCVVGMALQSWVHAKFCPVLCLASVDDKSVSLPGKPI